MTKKILPILIFLLCVLDLQGANLSEKAFPVITDKTLVVWAYPANLTQKGSGLISLHFDECFDAIVLGEIQQGKWMAGSDYHTRTQIEQNDYPLETAKPGEMVCIAIVYKSNRIIIYRNGDLYAQYERTNRDFDLNEKSKVIVSIGMRYALNRQGCFEGEIEEARIYDVALEQKTIQELQPNIISDPKPLGMWTFENGSISDAMSNFPDGNLIAGAKIIDGKLRPDGHKGSFEIYVNPLWKAEKVQAGFYTPRCVGHMWDTWLYYHDGKYYMYYINWDGHELAVSDDGVYWQEYGTMYLGHKTSEWVGTGHIWKSPEFDNGYPYWIMNYSEDAGEGKGQEIKFAVSKNLTDWIQLGKNFAFTYDSRWYKINRWDCIDVLKAEDGGFYGYFTALPLDRFKGEVCEFGMGRSTDGIRWKALPPPKGNVHGEFGGIHKINGKYYITVGGGGIGVGDTPEGLFYKQKKNFNAVNSPDTYFVRFFHNAPDSPLMNHFYSKVPVITALVKDVEVDEEGIFRFKWWKNNEKLKKERLTVELTESNLTESMILFKDKVDLGRTTVIEGSVRFNGDDMRGVYFEDLDGGKGYCALFGNGKARFGRINPDCSDADMTQFADREINLGNIQKFRVVAKNDVMELYLNDYLMAISRIKTTGKIGFICGSDKDAFENIQVWQAPAGSELN